MNLTHIILFNFLTGATPSDAVVVPEAEAEFSGGFWEAYDREMVDRDRIRRKRRKVEELAERAQDKIEREIALELRKHEAEQARVDELNRLRELVERHQEGLALSERVSVAAERAILQRNFSAMEALERELQRLREEELFMLEAIRLITSGGPVNG